MTWFLLYLFVMSGAVAGMLLTLGKILVIPSVIYNILMFLGSAAKSTEYYGKFDDVWENKVIKKFRKLTKWTIPIGTALIIVATLIPSPKQLAMIVGGGITYEVLTSEPAKQIGGKALELLNKKIDEALESEEHEIKGETL